MWYQVYHVNTSVLVRIFQRNNQKLGQEIHINEWSSKILENKYEKLGINLTVLHANKPIKVH